MSKGGRGLACVQHGDFVAHLDDALTSMLDKREATIAKTVDGIKMRMHNAMMAYDGVSDTIRVSTVDFQKKLASEMYSFIIRNHLKTDPMLVDVEWEAHEDTCEIIIYVLLSQYPE